MLEFETVDRALADAIGSLPKSCPFMGCGDQEMTFGVVKNKNLVCDRYIVWRCGSGHEGMVAILDD
ncbi:MAG: hypothetical protein Q7S36_02540 [Candidatus Liptonbacteria bacterium]|nr:hypothetical protein [Candidatus Liptonbacteria bacterium]